MSETKLETKHESPYPSESSMKTNVLANSYTRGSKEDNDEPGNTTVASVKLLK